MARCCRLPGYARNCSRPLPGVAVLLQSGGDGGGAERHCRRHRAAVGRPPCWSPGRRLVPFLGMPSTFPVLRSLGDLRCRQTSWNAPTFLCRMVPRQAPTQWARCRPGGLVVCGGWPLLSWWRLPVSPILQMGKQRPGSSVTQPGLWHLSCGAPGQEPVGTARGGGVEADTPTAPCPPPAGAGSAPGADPAPGQHVTWAGVPGWHPRATAGRGNSVGQETQRWATRAAWSALNPVPLFSRTNTTMLLTKSSRPSGECGVAGGPGPGRLRPGAPRQHLGKRRRSGCGSSARGVQAAVRLAGAP